VCEPSKNNLREKLDHIKKEYDCAISTAQHLGDRVAQIRTWNVTVLVAYFGYMMSADCDRSTFPLWPILGAVSLFWMMEAFTKALCDLISYSVLGRIDGLFATSPEEDFWKKVKEYEFWRLQDRPYKLERPREKEWSEINARSLLKLLKADERRKLYDLYKYEYSAPRRFVTGLVNAQTIPFYLLPLILLLLWRLLAWLF